MPHSRPRITTMHNRSLALLATTLLAGTNLSAQDLIGVNWSGQVVLIDSMTAAATPLGVGLPGQNALGRDGSGNLWCTTRTSSVPYVYGYTLLDPNTGSATVVHTNTLDIRGLCEAGGTDLFGINEGSPDRLVRIDTVTGTATTLGNTGFSSIQGLAMHQGTLYAWDLNQGILVVDPNTGVATDPFPSVGGPIGLQFLCSHPDGRLLAGGGSTTNSLYDIDLTTGAANVIGVMTGATDLRGLEALGGYASPFGIGCSGASGPVTLTVTGNINAGGNVVAVSNNHTPNALGAMVLGISTSFHQGLPLPLLLDSLLGTNGCTLYTSIDASVIGFSSAATPATMTFAFNLSPAAGGAIFHMQHACFEPVQGGLSWSNAVSLHIGM
jgi:hypothetical protein